MTAQGSVFHPPDTIVDMRLSDSELYKTLFDLSQSIAGHSDLGSLCNSLANALRRVVSFDFLALILHDPIHDRLRLHAVSGNRPHKEKEVVLPADGDHVGARVWRTQKPLVLSPLDEEAHGSDVVRDALEHGIHAFTLLPLSNGARRLGILGFGFAEAFTPDAEALAFLERVASEVAVSVDGYLTHQALLHERDRMRVLFEIAEALVSKLPMEELLPAVSEQLNRVVAHDFALMTLLDKATGEIHLNGLHLPGGVEIQPGEKSARPEGLPAGEALATGKPVATAGSTSNASPRRSTVSTPSWGSTGELRHPADRRQRNSGSAQPGAQVDRAFYRRGTGPAGASGASSCECHRKLAGISRAFADAR